MQIKSNSSVSFEATFQPILNALSAITHQLGRGAVASDHADDLHAMLETLPISTDDFGIASNRIRNAQRYLASKEVGAAVVSFAANRYSQNCSLNPLLHRVSTKLVIPIHKR